MGSFFQHLARLVLIENTYANVGHMKDMQRKLSKTTSSKATIFGRIYHKRHTRA